MSLPLERVRHVAALARLHLEEQEVADLAVHLGNILKHVEQLEELDTSQVEATEHLAVERLRLQPDEPNPGLSHEAALSPAPRILNDGFAVPAFVDEG